MNRYSSNSVILLGLGLLLIFVGTSTPQSLLPTNEFNSLLWLVRMYGHQVPQTQPEICNNTLGIYCANSTSGYHVTNIYIRSSVMNVGTPPSITNLDFPELTALTVSSNIIPFAFNASFNILSMIKNIPKVFLIQFNYDPYISTIPPDFPVGLPALKRLEIWYSPNLLDIPQFFNNTVATSIDVSHTTIKSVSLNESYFLPNINYLDIGFAPISPQTITISSKSFPKLNSLVMYNLGNTIAPTIYYNATAISILLSSSVNGPGFNLIVDNTGYLTYFTLLGKSVLTPSSLNNYPNLQTVDFQGRNLTAFPFTTFPPKLSSFSCQFCSFPNIDSFVFPSTFRSLDLSNNALNQAMPWSQFSNVSASFSLKVNNNPQLSGVVPESFCQVFFQAKNTSISAFPDCYWCYYGDNEIFPTTLTKPLTFSCNITIDSYSLYTKQGLATITGNNIGWGNDAIILRPIIPNKVLIYNSHITSGPPVIQNVSLNYVVPGRSFNFTVLEVGITILINSATQIPFGAEFNAYVVINDYLIHNYSLMSATTNQTYPLLASNVSTTLYNFRTISPIPIGNYFIKISNSYNNYTSSSSQYFSISYPVIVNANTTNPYIKPGSIFNVVGSFGTNFANVSARFNNQTECTVIYINETFFNCTLQQYLPLGYNSLTFSVDGYTRSYINVYYVQYSAQATQCMEETNNCFGNGACNSNGICVCKSSSFYQNCSIAYPRVTSGDYDMTDRKNITLYGDFGPFNQSNPSVKVNNTICIIQTINQQMINCTLQSELGYGLASATVNVDALNYYGNEVINFLPPPSNPSNQQECQTRTSNCNNHGFCTVNGTCECDQNFNPEDDCFTQFSNNVTYIANQTTPNAAFEGVNGFEFNFQIQSIQEVNYDDTVLYEIFTKKWNSTITTTPTLTTGIYQLSIGNDSVQYNTQITAIISFSQSARDIDFGSRIIHINPNSVKLSLNITNWIFSSNLATLRVVFSTKINNEQFIKYDCKNREINTFTNNDQSSSIKYLRVVKDNIQYNGRFIDYALSDGRMTYSKTELINKTSINNQQSNVFIGITLPQCRECILDPDFSPLLLAKNNDDDCNSESSKSNNNWKIAVGVVVGVGSVVVTAATIMIIKKKRSISLVIHNIKLRSK